MGQGLEEAIGNFMQPQHVAMVDQDREAEQPSELSYYALGITSVADLI